MNANGQEIVDRLDALSTNLSDPETDPINITSLSLHQGSAQEAVGELCCSIIQEGGEVGASIEADLAANLKLNDGRNMCMFLALDIAKGAFNNRGKCKDETSLTEYLKEEAENVIRHLPATINTVRNANELYSAEDAIDILKNNAMMPPSLLAAQMLQPQTNWKEGAHALMRSVNDLLESPTDECAIYVCTPVALTVGKAHLSEGRQCLYVVDTHGVQQCDGGTGNVVMISITMDSNGTPDCARSILRWINGRLWDYSAVRDNYEGLYRIYHASNLEKCEVTNDDVSEEIYLSDSDLDISQCLGEIDVLEREGIIKEEKKNQSGGSDGGTVIDEDAMSTGIPRERNECPLQSWETPDVLPQIEEDKIRWLVLLTKFELTSFKEFQLEALNVYLHSRDSLVIQATGSGKSVCYQIPALMNTDKFAVVICPTVSLIESQVDELSKHGIDAVMLGPHEAHAMSSVQQWSGREKTQPCLYNTRVDDGCNQE